MRIEKANSFDHKVLSELTKKSKAHWGYSPDQIKKWDTDLTISSSYIETNEVYKLYINGKVIGYYSYQKLNSQIAKLDNLFVLPDHIGKGFGKYLMDDFLEKVRKEGFIKVTLDADPNAEEFYKNFGFTIVGRLASSIRDRSLPIMEKAIMTL